MVSLLRYLIERRNLGPRRAENLALAASDGKKS